jgi:hypothetical protein
VTVAVILYIVPIFLVVYFLPAIIARSKNKRNRVDILALNLLLGWTLLGWLLALIWACRADPRRSAILRTADHEGWYDVRRPEPGTDGNKPERTAAGRRHRSRRRK